MLWGGGAARRRGERVLRERLNRRRGGPIDDPAPESGRTRRSTAGRFAVGASLATLGSAVLLLGGGASSALAADDCSNAEFRVGPSALLPDCRAYELVSAGDKGGYTFTMPNNVMYPSATGDSLYAQSVTPFADPNNGNRGAYLFHRGIDGWAMKNMMPAYCRPDQSGQQHGLSVDGVSGDFSTVLINDPADSNCAPGDESGVDIYRVGPDERYTWISHNGVPKAGGETASLYGVSQDASHMLFTTPERLVMPLESGRSVGPGLYDRTKDGVRAVGLTDNGSLLNACGVMDLNSGDRRLRQVSVDGRAIFFRTGSSTSVSGCSPVTDDGGQLYVRIDHERTLLLSESQLSTPEARRVPVFLGSSDDGRRAFFRSAERLTADAPAGGGLYEYDLSAVLAGSAAEGQLRLLSPTAGGGAAGVGQIRAMSSDGATVYFQASGVLDHAAPASGDKLYVARNGTVKFVALLHLPANQLRASASEDGSKFVFLDRPTGSSFTQVLLYSAVDESTTCVSCPLSGGSPTGNARLGGSISDGRPENAGAERFVTDDGRVYFNSPEQLAERDTNAVYDVYEFHAGDRRLMSAGIGAYDSWLVGSSSSGRDVFFSTQDSLLAEDIDSGSQDVYVARAGGGFAQPEGSAGVCTGDACQGRVAQSPGVLLPGTAGYVGAGNIPDPMAKKDKPSSKLTLVKGSRSVRGTSGRVRVRVSGKGKIRTSGSGLRRSTRNVSRSGTAYRVPVRLSARAKRTLKRRGRVQLRVTVRFTPEEGKVRSKRVRMTFREKRNTSSRSKSRAGKRAVSAVATSDVKGGR